MGVSDRFSNFLSNISLTSNQMSDGSSKRESVCKILNDNYYNFVSGTANSRYVGSWDKMTRVRPPRDVDVMFSLPKSVYDRYQSRSGNKQSQLLQEIKGVLQNTYPSTFIKGHGPVVVVNFTSYAVEILPAFKLSNSGYYIPDTSDDGKYLTTDPDAEKKKLTDEGHEGNTRNLVRMLKCWQSECSVPMKSFWLELLAIDFLSTWEHADKSKVYYDWMVRDFLIYLVGKASSFVIVPGTYEIIWIGDAWRSRAESARDRAKKATEYENSDPKYPSLALVEWRKIFGNYIS